MPRRSCEREPERAWAVNVGFSTEISRLAVDNGAWLCALSTDLVFDGLDRAPIGGFSESDQTKPRSIYAKSKFEAENVVISSDPRAMVIRSSLIYGPEIGGKAGPLGWMHQAFSARQEVTLFGDEWRTPIYVADLTSVIHALIDHRPAGIWHLGGPERKSREEFGLAFALTHGYDRSLVRVVSRDQVVSIPARPRDVSLNSQSLCSKFRFTLHSLSDGLSQSRRFMHQNYS